MAYATIEARPIWGALGAEIHGIDLSRSLDDRVIGDIRQALLDHLVIFFRDQDISPAQPLAFAKRFGGIHLHPFNKPLDGHPNIIEILKTEDDTRNNGGRWHSDQMYTPKPAKGTMLYAREMPPFGGDTQFANLHLGYEALSDGMKAMLSGVRTVNLHSSEKMTGRDMAPDFSNGAPKPVEHPLIRTHPETGRKSLYLSCKGINRRLADMTMAESKPLLEFLLDHIARPEFTCRFRWRPGSLAFWDNRAALHSAVNDYHGHRRLMHRVTIKGDAVV